MKRFLPYGRQEIDASDLQAVRDVLESSWLTTGPKVEEFEQQFATFVDSEHAIAVSSGTAALHSAMFALGILPGDEVLVPALTFAATANAVRYQGGTPVFCDVDPETLLIDPKSVASKISQKTRAMIVVDYAGQPCDYAELRGIADSAGIKLVSDSCHALGATYRGKSLSQWVDLAAFSFHPVKHITTAEGGMVTTANAEFADRLRRFRNHGIQADHRERERQGTWKYDMIDLGYNYRLSDLQCALGISQLRRLPGWLNRRRSIAARYVAGFKGLPGLRTLKVREGREHAYHLFVLKIEAKDPAAERARMFHQLRERGLGVNVHYAPVHLHSYYQEHLGTRLGDCPQAEQVAESILSIPMYPSLSDADVDATIELVRSVRLNGAHEDSRGHTGSNRK